MTKNVHPKTAGAGVGAAVGLLIVALMHQFGAHPVPELPGAITGFAAAVGAWLAPSGGKS